MNVEVNRTFEPTAGLAVCNVYACFKTQREKASTDMSNVDITHYRIHTYRHVFIHTKFYNKFYD